MVILSVQICVGLRVLKNSLWMKYLWLLEFCVPSIWTPRAAFQALHCISCFRTIPDLFKCKSCWNVVTWQIFLGCFLWRNIVQMSLIIVNIFQIVHGAWLNWKYCQWNNEFPIIMARHSVECIHSGYKCLSKRVNGCLKHRSSQNIPFSKG